MEHTPGPWTVGGQYGHLKSEILALDGSKAIAAVWTHKFNRDKDAAHMSTVPDPEGETNARVIEAAPDLLEACELRLWAVVNRYREDEPCPRHQQYGCPYPGETRQQCSRCITETCHAAVAKARME